MRTRSAADIASDHHMVVAEIKLKIKKHWTTRETALKTFNTSFL